MFQQIYEPIKKLHKRQCVVRLRAAANGEYTIFHADHDFQVMRLPSWELVSLWHQLSELMGVDEEDLRHLLEQRFWRDREEF